MIEEAVRESRSARALRLVPTTGIDAESLVRRFRRTLALDGVSLTVAPGEIHALLGPNGAGKTTLVRILSGVIAPTSGTVSVAGLDAVSNPRELRTMLGIVPSGDRSFYLRISGFENLVFFARMHGLRRKAAGQRASELLEHVGLAEASGKRVGEYSHGMQKRLSVARALLTDPRVMLVDEATHDLDPEGSRRVQALVGDAAERGAAVLWATQRLEEIRGFARSVTLLDRGRVRFQGSVPRLLEHAVPRRYVVRLRNGRPGEIELQEAQRALGRAARITPPLEEGSEHHVIALSEDAVLGDAVAALARANVQVLACRQERSEIEEAFLALTQERPS
ncbi:MAG TPA: ABC transporter ATP-binding protein [Gaiellaceae bacterium]|nr:ABC transporter ATP-binding protein [Gaiellaceae bacterium]